MQVDRTPRTQLSQSVLQLQSPTLQMAASLEIESLAKAFSGFGVDEKYLILTLGKWRADQAEAFRQGAPFFAKDERHFERWNDHVVEQLKHEFLRFKSAVVLWTMHPWERDARLMRDAIINGPKSNNVIVELACTRSSEQLLGTRRAYHSLFDRSLEEDVASHVNPPERKLLVGLVSAYRYEGPRVHEDVAKSEAKTLSVAVKNADGKNPIEHEEVVRILSTRSKLHLRAVFNLYKEISGKDIDEDLVENSILLDTVQCLSTPYPYFVKVLSAAMNHGADENTKEGLTRVIVTQADADMKRIEKEYKKQNQLELSKKIEQITKGSFKDFLLALLAREALLEN